MKLPCNVDWMVQEFIVLNHVFGEVFILGFLVGVYLELSLAVGDEYW